MVYLTGIIFILMMCGMGIFFAMLLSMMQKSLIYYKILSILKAKHQEELAKMYGFDPGQNAVFKYDPVLSDSAKSLIPGFYRWEFWTAPRPTWIWEFMGSKEDFGDPVLRDLKLKYTIFNRRRFAITAALCSLVIMVSLIALIR